MPWVLVRELELPRFLGDILLSQAASKLPDFGALAPPS